MFTLNKLCIHKLQTFCAVQSPSAVNREMKDDSAGNTGHTIWGWGALSVKLPSLQYLKL